MPDDLPALPIEGNNVRVLLADDEEMSRRGLSSALDGARGIAVVGHARIGPDIRTSLLACQPHIMLLNAATASDWVDIVQGVLSSLLKPGTLKVMVVIDVGSERQVFQAVQSGATGVLQRNMSAEELGYAVRQVALGHSVISPAATSWVLTRLRMLANWGSSGIASAEALDVLSIREREILAALASGKSNQEIATATRLSLATVKSHVSNILAKLDVRDRVQAALLGQSAGIGAEFQLGTVPLTGRDVSPLANRRAHEPARAVKLGQREPLKFPARRQRDRSLLHQHNVI
jgi:DNA-binding NarL/FixJ family response regulator